MRRSCIPGSGFGALAGAALALVSLKGGFDCRPILGLGAIGAVIGTVGGVLVRISAPPHPTPTNPHALVGCLVGAACGGPRGVMLGLGQPMLALFNPDLPA